MLGRMLIHTILTIVENVDILGHALSDKQDSVRVPLQFPVFTSLLFKLGRLVMRYKVS